MPAATSGELGDRLHTAHGCSAEMPSTSLFTTLKLCATFYQPLSVAERELNLTTLAHSQQRTIRSSVRLLYMKLGSVLSKKCNPHRLTQPCPLSGR